MCVPGYEIYTYNFSISFGMLGGIFHFYSKGRSHMRPRMDFHLVLHGEYL